MSILHEIQKKSDSINTALKQILTLNQQPTELYGLIQEFLNYGGKRLRPILCLLSAESVGGKEDNTIKAAIAIELFHNFTLIHDDIEDNSLLRRGKPCLHLRHGIPLAINAGDGLYAIAYKAIISIDCTSEKKLRVFSLLNDAFLKVIEGQAIELGWIKNKKWNLTIQDYMQMIECKTGALLAVACQVGALLADASESQQKVLYDFGMALGTAFQIQDDVLNLIGQEEKYNKEIGGDITEGKRTLMVLHALNNTNLRIEDKKYLTELLDNHTLERSELEWAITFLRDSGAIDYAQKLSAQLIHDSIKNLLEIDIETNKLVQLAEYLINRNG